jgi:hydrogenase maturation protease
MRTLVIGYGNPSRRDDGVALHVVNALRAHWGRPPLAPGEDGADELEGVRDSIFVQQLAPELAPLLPHYDLAVFVDAALPHAPSAVCVEPLQANLRLAAVSHHMEPATLLVLAATLYGRAPQAFLVSIRGQDFDFGEDLSATTGASVRAAADHVLQLISGRPED